MTKEPTIKILVGYHKPAVLLQSEILTPIHLGRALATEASKDGQMSKADYQWMLDNMIGDDTGDNISNLNREFCELTGIYWAWKNYDKLGNPDYIGFMHYCRHFHFKANQHEYLEKNYWYTSYITKEYMENAGLNDENIKKILKKYDAIFPCPVKHNFSVITEFYNLAKALDLNHEYFDNFIEIAKKMNPCLKIAIEKYLSKKYEISCNMFVMKKELFFDYVKMLFPTIFFMHEKINYSELSLNGKRVLAYSAEKLLASYATLIKEANMYNIGMLPISKTKDNEINNVVTLKKAFTHNNFTIVYVSDDNYAKYTAVSIKSLVTNFPENKNLDIIILSDNISKDNEKKLSEMKKNNISIRFYDMKRFSEKRKYYTHGHFKRANYFRAYIANILPYHDSILYLDGDTIILGNISELFDSIKFKKGQYIAAAPAINPIHSALRGNFLKIKNMRLIDYWKNILKINNPIKYFNTGVMLLNLEEMRKINFEDIFLNKLDEIMDPPGVDQDIFNAIASDNCLMLPQKWNFMGYGDWKNFDKWLPSKLACDFYQAQNFPNIIHYASAQKPWSNPSISNGNYFWQYAKMTPFYEEIVLNMIKNNYDKDKINENLIVEPSKKIMNIKLFIYQVLFKITFGSIKKKMEKKIIKYKNKGTNL